jgi:hypothetical protein
MTGVSANLFDIPPEQLLPVPEQDWRSPANFLACRAEKRKSRKALDRQTQRWME